MQTQEDRNKALESAAEEGVIRDYTGWRQSLKGTRFQIKDCTLFNLETPTGKKVSQCYCLLTHICNAPCKLKPAQAFVQLSFKRQR